MRNKAGAFSVTIGDSPNEISKAKNSVILKKGLQHQDWKIDSKCNAIHI